MGISSDTILVLRDSYSKKILIHHLNEISEIDIKNCNYEIWSNIGWTKI